MLHADQPSGHDELVHTLVHEGCNGTERANDAMALLMEEFTPMLRVILRQRGVQHSDMDDLLQEIFLRAPRKMHQLNDPDRLKAWMASITVRLSINHHVRKKMARSLDGFIEEHGIPSALQSHADDAQETMIADEDAMIVRRTISTLNKIDRDALQGFYFAKLSLQEMHEASGAEGGGKIPVGTIKRRLHTARARVREKLSPHLTEE